MQIKASQAISFCFCTADPTTGSGLDPTTPGTATSGKLYINGVQHAATVTLTDDAASSAGITKVAYTVPSTVTEGDSVQCIITATVNTIAASTVVRDDYVVTAYASEIKAKTDNLPASPAAIGSAMGAVASVTAGVTVADKTGFSLTVTPPTAAAIVTAVEASIILAKEATVAAIPTTSPWDTVAASHTGAGTFGYYFKRIFGWLFWKQNATTTQRTFYDADSTTILGTQTISGDGTTTTTVSKEA